MKQNLIIGIDESTDIDSLLSDGIEQFYFGYIPPSYIQKYATQTSLNRRYRPKEQFSDIDLIYKIINKIKSKNATIYLALNSFTSNHTMNQYAKEVFELFCHRVDGVIVANISIATMLKNFKYDKLIISNLFGVYTTQAVAFLIEQFKPIKIILPRDISLDNIKTIVTTFPNMDFECFLYGDNCRFSESFCFSEHGYDSIGFGSLCSYANDQKILIHSSSPSYKHTIKNSTLDDNDKKEFLQKRPIDIQTLLDELVLYSYEFDSTKISKILDILSMYDLQMFYTDKLIYLKAIHTLDNISFPKAKELLKLLRNKPFAQEDRYKIFHKLNQNAISQTIEFFAKFPNITSYKIPSRGRELYKYIFAKHNENYNYKQSQYRL